MFGQKLRARPAIVRRMASHTHATPPPEAADDWTVDQAWSSYTPDEHATWDTLYARQMELAQTGACRPLLAGLEALDLGRGGIPDLEPLNRELSRLTGWTVAAVPGLVPDEVFFRHLSQRVFPAGRFIRDAGHLDYLQEPDVFHDIFGHVPMLTDPVFADYLQAYGRGGLRALEKGRLSNLARLYWYTVEFGLLHEDGRLKTYGAGIISSHKETVFALGSPAPARLKFDLERVMRTPYRIDDLQQVYFVVPSLQALLDATQQDFDDLYQRLAEAADLAPDRILPGDRLDAWLDQ